MKPDVLNRRQWLRLSGTFGALSFFRSRLITGEELIPAESAIDHLLLGAADLDQGIAWVERMTGIQAVIGGSHPGVGTRNALMSLGGRRYLEIIAPDPDQTAYNFYIDVRRLAEPRFITWAATADIDATAKKAREAGYQIFGPSGGSRARPDGKVLKWKTLGVLTQFGRQGVDPMPFFIEWAPNSPHPSRDSPKGCELQSFEIEHPEAAALAEALRKLGIETSAKEAKDVRLIAAFNTPKGKVELS